MSDEMEWTGILQPDETVSVQRSSFEGSCPVHLDRTSVWFSSKDDVFNKIINCTVSDDGIMKQFWMTDSLGKAVSHCLNGQKRIACVEDKQKPVTVVACLVSDDKKTVWFPSDKSTFHIDDFSSQFSFEKVAAAKVELVETAEINHCAVCIADQKYNCAVSEDGAKFWFKDCVIVSIFLLSLMFQKKGGSQP